MIRFRVGQSWRREPPGPSGPFDAFGLEVDGVNLLPWASNEPLVQVVGGLLEAMGDLVVGHERGAEVSLESVPAELCFWRRPGLEVEVTAVRFDGSPRKAQPTLVVELPALVEATLRCAKGLFRELSATDAGGVSLAALEASANSLASTVVKDWPAHAPAPPWTTLRRSADLGYELTDVDGRAASPSRGSKGGLTALLIDGIVTRGPDVRVEGWPFVLLTGLARAATGGRATLAGRPVEPAAVFQAGLELCLALRAHRPGLAKNPWLEALQIRCVDGLKDSLAPRPDPTPLPTPLPPRAAASAPMSPLGEVRRVALEPQWSRPVALGEEGGRLLLGRSGVIVASPHAAHAFTAQGRTAYRRLSPQGVATSSTSTVCAADDRLLLFERGSRSASWMRDHDGAPIGPRLEPVGGVLVTTMGRRGLVGLDPSTGRERWRFEPPRTQRSHLTVAGTRLLVAADSGALYGLDAPTGQVRFTVRSSVPFAGPVVRAGRRVIAVLRRADLAIIYACEALTSSPRAPAGNMAWTRELVLSGPSSPIVTGGRIFLTGHRDKRAMVIALSLAGRVLWERPTPLEPLTQMATAFEGGVIVADARGSALRLLPNGEVAWFLGCHGDQLSHSVGPVIRRQVLVVPGPSIRLVEPRGGRVLGELETGPHVLDVAVDPRLTVFVLKDPGTLEAWRPSAVLALVPGPPPAVPG